ncbi:MAG TPA: hypothetical protein PKN99_14060 [Cyclobacteriaceae bacterium]|jgi:VIT1/CCC1 family predicted Fe2+/Mn2+ transporter|nr:hypothetical protein [Cyclobacteriaceae bacterium]HRK52662.1 hypothetical protein [Cyclobacteriaceae bacterium]
MKTIKTKIEPDNYLAPHFISRSNWLRAAVLGANDGMCPDHRSYFDAEH